MSTASWMRQKMEHLFRNNLFLYREIERLRRLEQLSDEEQENRKREKALKLVRFARSQSPFYRKFYSGFSTSDRFENVFPALPFLHKSQIREHVMLFPTVSRKFLRRADTSGTSGTPLSVYRSPGSIIRESAYVWNFRMSHGLNPGEPIASMRATLDRNTLYRYNKIDNVLYLSCYLLSKENISTYIRVLNEFRPKALCALPSSTYTLVNLMHEQGLGCEIPLVFTSSETLYPFQREKIEKTLNAKVVDSYGNAERTIQIGQCAFGNYHEFPLYSYNEYTASGIYTTSLINRSFPLIRYHVEDQVTPITSGCKCGKKQGFQSVEGRFEDVVILEDGSYVTALGMAFRGIEHLSYAQIIQEKYTEVNVNLVINPGFSRSHESVLLNKLQQRLGPLPKININYVGEHEIIKTCSGKFTLVVSRLNNPKASMNKFAHEKSLVH